MAIFHKGMVVVMAAYLSACSWVDVTPQGEKVRVLSAAEVTGCQRLGKTTVNTAARIGLLDRYPQQVQDELETLARNSASDLGGDTVVPLGTPADGRQVYEIYRCVPQPQR